MRIMYNFVGRDALYKIWNASEEYMIIYFSTDGGSLVFSDAIYPIEEGGICFIAPRNLHYTMPSDPQGYVRSKIFIDEKTMRAILGTVSAESAFYRLFSENKAVYAKIGDNERERVEKLFSDAKARYERSGAEEGIAASFFYLLTLISDSIVDSNTKTPDSFLTKAIEYINSEYSGEISLDELCRVANMSKSHFCRKFKSEMGMTVMEYIFKTRIAAAETLLASEDLSISQISERCGFSSISYFCQKFKAQTGISANKYRAGKREPKQR